MMNTLFLDESNRTGTQKYDGKWNFEEQPYFSLCGILCPEGSISQLDVAVTELRTVYHIQGNELKATKDSVRKNHQKIMLRLLELQKQLLSLKNRSPKMLMVFLLFRFRLISARPFTG